MYKLCQNLGEKFLSGLSNLRLRVKKNFFQLSRYDYRSNLMENRSFMIL